MSESETFNGASMEGKLYAIPEGDDEHLYYSALSLDGKYLACVFGNGALRIMEPSTLVTVTRSGAGARYAELPCTCVKWFPFLENNSYKLVTVSSAGGVFLWLFDGTTLERTHTIDEGKNEVASVDVAANGATFLTAGSDRIVRLYETATGKLLHELTRGCTETGLPRPTHVNRIFSVRFVTNTLAASAGWECPVQLWDLRTFRSDRQLVGVQCASDCLEPIPNTSLMLVVSNRVEKPLELYDCISCRELQHESSQLTSQLQSKERVSVARVCKETGHLWCLSPSPPALVVLAFGTGKVLGRLPLPTPGLNIELDSQCHSKCFVSCHKGNMVVASLHN